MTLTATCHCGGTRIELPRLPERRLECNCTYCAKTGAVWGYFGAGEMKFVKDEHDRIYTKSGANNHHFCSRCGMQTWGDTPDWSEVYNFDGTPKDGHAAGDMPTGRSYAVNLKLLDDFDISNLTAEKVDGRNNW
jgi:hypothetical protein